MQYKCGIQIVKYYFIVFLLKFYWIILFSLWYYKWFNWINLSCWSILWFRLFIKTFILWKKYSKFISNMLFKTVNWKKKKINFFEKTKNFIFRVWDKWIFSETSSFLMPDVSRIFRRPIDDNRLNIKYIEALFNQKRKTNL